MNANQSLDHILRLLPGSPNELEQFVQETLGRFIQQDKGERAAIYSRPPVIDPKVKRYSMEMQPDISKKYARSKGWIFVATDADLDRSVGSLFR